MEDQEKKLKKSKSSKSKVKEADSITIQPLPGLTNANKKQRFTPTYGGLAKLNEKTILNCISQLLFTSFDTHGGFHVLLLFRFLVVFYFSFLFVSYFITCSQNKIIKSYMACPGSV